MYDGKNLKYDNSGRLQVDEMCIRDRWVQIARVVDSNNLSADGTLIASKLYINGQEWITKDSDGNVVPAYVTKNCMQASDNFDFLLGVNYWDSVFKGAFDELYIYDYALNAEQVAACRLDTSRCV